jgi:hypothetical protein
MSGSLLIRILDKLIPGTTNKKSHDKKPPVDRSSQHKKRHLV